MNLPQKIPVRKTIVLALVSGLLIFIIFKTLVNAGDFFNVVRNINLFYFYLAFATMVPTLLLNAVKWNLVMRSAGLRVSLWKTFKITTSTLSFSVIPGRLGDFTRSYPLRAIIPVSQSVGTIIIEKVVDLCVLLVFAGSGLMLLGHIAVATPLFVLAIVGIPILYAAEVVIKKVSSRSGLADKIHGALSILGEIKKRKAVFFMAVLSSCADWTMSMLQAYWLFKAVGATVPFSAIYAFLPLSIFAGLLPITLAGVGTRDSALIYFFRYFATSGQSLAVGILYSTQTYFAMSLLGIPFLYYFFQNDK